LFVAVVWAVCRLLPGLPASLRCALWWLACLKVLVSLASPIELPWLSAPESIPAVVTLDLAAPPAAEPMAVPSDPPFHFPWAGALAGIWLAGVIAQLAGKARQLEQARRIVRRANPVGEPWIAARFADLRRQLGLSERADVRLSPDV